ncbi:MAG: N-acetyltransferase [Herbinix sp.]|jgi:RimJ/RimL family protein N-acetyltransferase|nr:N-acetyltransferase [Herbinix sp.]
MILTTERMILRPFEEKDEEAVHNYAGNPDNVVYMIWGPNTKEQTKQFIQDTKKNWEKESVTNYDFGIVLKETGELIGGCGIYLNDTRKEGMLGWILHKDYWKKGLMPEVAMELIRFGFDELQLHRIYATCNAANYGSYRVMEKCGMQKEAHFRKNRYGRDGSEDIWYDEFYYAILDEEWAAR